MKVVSFVSHKSAKATIVLLMTVGFIALVTVGVTRGQKSYGDGEFKGVDQSLCLPTCRNGRPVDSTTHVKFYFVPAFYRLQ